MDAFTIAGFVLGLFGLIAFARVHRLSRQVYLLRLDVREAAVRASVPAEKGSCGCGGGCG